jgi:hypothetical protein
MEDEDLIVVHGIRVKPEVLRKEAIRPCAGSNCKAACCSGGVWLKEGEDQRIMEWAATVKDCLPADRHDDSKWFVTRDIEVGTTTVEDPERPGNSCCVFLRPDRRCSLHVVSREKNLGWPGIKPYYCTIYPLYIEDNVLMMDDNTAFEPDCGSSHKIASNALAMYEIYRDEALLILGEAGYRELQEKAAARVVLRGFPI